MVNSLPNLFLAVLLLAASAAHAADHTVGGASGWTQGVDYDTWAQGQTFRVGDRLIFQYTPNHSVDEVNQADYTSCNSASPIGSHTSSPTTISLSTVGTFYYICPTGGHCNNGMKVSVTVAAAATPTPTPPSPTPPTTGTPPSPTPPTAGTPPTTGTPPSTSSPPPPAGNGVGGSKSSLAVGSIVVGAVIVMGLLV